MWCGVAVTVKVAGSTTRAQLPWLHCRVIAQQAVPGMRDCSCQCPGLGPQLGEVLLPRYPHADRGVLFETCSTFRHFRDSNGIEGGGS